MPVVQTLAWAVLCPVFRTTPIWQDRQLGSRTRRHKKEQSRYKVNSGLTQSRRMNASGDCDGGRSVSLAIIEKGKGPTYGPFEFGGKARDSEHGSRVKRITLRRLVMLPIV